MLGPSHGYVCTWQTSQASAKPVRASKEPQLPLFHPNIIPQPALAALVQMNPPTFQGSNRQQQVGADVRRLNMDSVSLAGGHRVRKQSERPESPTSRGCADRSKKAMTFT